MKKELILLACMTAVPCMLNSAGRWADTAVANNPKDTLNHTALSDKDRIDHWLYTPEQFMESPKCTNAVYSSESGSHLMGNAPLSGALLERKQTKVRSSIRANWVLDTAASQRSSALVYMDKDNPNLKAVIFTDNAGNMLMRLEQDGVYHEIRVKKIEFHTSANMQSSKHQINRWRKSGVVSNGNEKRKLISGIRKGAGYVPV